MHLSPAQLDFFQSDSAREAATHLDEQRMPRHVAIIMDGNGRWAAAHGKPRLFGHRAGVAAVRESIATAVQLNLDYLTVYSFSSENWSRPEDEVSGLMALFVEVLHREVKSLNELNVRVRVIGNLEGVPESTRRAFEACVSDTAANTGLTLVVAVNYGARQDIARAAASIARDVATGSLDAASVDADAVSSRLSTAGIPDPDVVIRTSGESRLSNFLLFESAYAELVVTDELWPDFDRESLVRALIEYQGRSRRFGGL